MSNDVSTFVRGTAAPIAGAEATSENFRKLPTSDDSGKSETPTVEEIPLPPRQATALISLLAGKTLAATAKEVGVSVRTLYTWRREPAFAAQLHRRTIETVDAGAMRACDLALRSTALLGQSMLGEDRYRWAFRIATSARIWELAKRVPKPEEFNDA